MSRKISEEKNITGLFEGPLKEWKSWLEELENLYGSGAYLMLESADLQEAFYKPYHDVEGSYISDWIISYERPETEKEKEKRLKLLRQRKQEKQKAAEARKERELRLLASLKAKYESK